VDWHESVFQQYKRWCRAGLRESALDAMRPTWQKVFSVAPGVTFVLYLLFGMSEEYSIQRLCTCLLAVSLSHVWFLQVCMMLCVYLTSIARNFHVPWAHNVARAAVSVQEVLDTQWELVTSFPSHFQQFQKLYHDSFYPRWYFVVMFVSNMFMLSGIVLITMHHLAGYQWNIIVHCYCVGVMTLWGLILMLFSRLGYVFFSTNNMSYVNLNMHYVQLEVDWMIITAMHWYYHVNNPDVAPPHMDRKYVWKHVTMRKIKADVAGGRCLALRSATFCNTLRHTAAHCTILQHTASHCNTRNTLQHTVTYRSTHCNALQHSATLYDTLLHTLTLYDTLRPPAQYCNTLHCIATHATHYNRLPRIAQHSADDPSLLLLLFSVFF